MEEGRGQDWEAREEEVHWTRCWDQYRDCWTPADLTEGEASDLGQVRSFSAHCRLGQRRLGWPRLWLGWWEPSLCQFSAWRSLSLLVSWWSDLEHRQLSPHPLRLTQRNNNTCSGGDTLARAGAAHRFIKAGGRDFTILNIFQVPSTGELLDVVTFLRPPLLSEALDPGVIVREGPTALTIKVIHQNLLIRVLDDLYLVVFVIFNFRLR